MLDGWSSSLRTAATGNDSGGPQEENRKTHNPRVKGHGSLRIGVLKPVAHTRTTRRPKPAVCRDPRPTLFPTAAVRQTRHSFFFHFSHLRFTIRDILKQRSMAFNPDMHELCKGCRRAFPIGQLYRHFGQVKNSQPNCAAYLPELEEQVRRAPIQMSSDGPPHNNAPMDYDIEMSSDLAPSDDKAQMDIMEQPGEDMVSQDDDAVGGDDMDDMDDQDGLGSVAHGLAEPGGF